MSQSKSKGGACRKAGEGRGKESISEVELRNGWIRGGRGKRGSYYQ